MSEIKQLRPIALMPEAVVQSGFIALFHKEVKRFYKVAFQTVAAPVLTAVLYLLIFGHVLENSPKIYGKDYSSFLIPGLVTITLNTWVLSDLSSAIFDMIGSGSPRT